jgi:hypothetical protein
MIFRWLVQFLNFLFIFSLGMIMLRLFYDSLASGKVRRSSPKPRAELLLEVLRDGAPFLKIPLTRSHYLIGRGPECDIPLRGMGVPYKAGELYQKEGEYFLMNSSKDLVINREQPGKGSRKVMPGDEIGIRDYSIRINQK